MQYFRFRSRRVFRRSLHKTLSAKKLTPGVDYENPCGSTVAVLSWAETLGLVLLELAAFALTLCVLWLVSRS